MSWLLPSALAIAALAAVVSVALHLIARSRPLAESLPTARFVPHRPVRAQARAIAPSDLLLLLLRIAAIAAIGAAVAAPVFAATRGRIRRIVLVDRSRSLGVTEMRGAADSAKGLVRDGDVIVAFDSAAAVLPNVSSLDSMRPSAARGSLSSALAMAQRVAVQASTQVDSIELAIVSPFSTEEFDSATARMRRAWPGRIRIVPVAASTTETAVPALEPGRNAGDVVSAGLSLMGLTRGSASVRVVRDRLAASDSAWARETGHVLLHWPATDAAATWPRRATIDAIGGVTSGTGTLIGRFPRLWTLSGYTVARWADGEPAAVEHAVGTGCIRDVGIVFDAASDLTLRATFRAFAAGLLEPCGGARRLERIDPAALSQIAGESGAPLAAANSLRDPTSHASQWTPWLLALGAVLLIGELMFRRSDGRLT